MACDYFVRRVLEFYKRSNTPENRTLSNTDSLTDYNTFSVVSGTKRYLYQSFHGVGLNKTGFDLCRMAIQLVKGHCTYLIEKSF